MSSVSSPAPHSLDDLGLDPRLFCVSKEVAHAIRSGFPVVALESTIITHGLPFPKNYETAMAAERCIRSRGALPATVAIVQGVVHVGASEEVIMRMAKLGKAVDKVARRDICAVIARKGNGSTTVSGTMALVSLVGITVFSTGGIGGVHRGGEVSLDISSDLTELARSRMLVVCAGIKSILDVPRTLEVLETYGVTVAAFNTPHIPAFYSRSSGVPAAVIVRDATGAAELLLAQEALGMHSSILITVPPPHDDAGDAAAIEEAIAVAINEARAQGIKGPQETPFLLQRVSELTDSKSLAANIALYLNNASVAADIACAHATQAASRRSLSSRIAAMAPALSSTRAALTAYSKVSVFYVSSSLKSRSLSLYPHTSSQVECIEPIGMPAVSKGICSRLSPQATAAPPLPINASAQEKHILVVGAAIFDSVGFTQGNLDAAVSNKSVGTVRWLAGGVGRNVCEAIARVGAGTTPKVIAHLLSAVGNDAAGELLLNSCQAAGVMTEYVTVLENVPTAGFVAVHSGSNGEIVAGVTGGEAMNHISPNMVVQAGNEMRKIDGVVVDANVPQETMRAACALAIRKSVPLWIEPVSYDKAAFVMSAEIIQHAFCIHPNLEELAVMATELGLHSEGTSIGMGDIYRLGDAVMAATNIKNIFVTLGAGGCCFMSEDSNPIVFPSFLKPSKVLSTSGAGDSAFGALIAVYTAMESWKEAAAAGMHAASLSCQSYNTVNLNLKYDPSSYQRLLDNAGAWHAGGRGRSRM